MFTSKRRDRSEEGASLLSESRIKWITRIGNPPHGYQSFFPIHDCHDGYTF